MGLETSSVIRLAFTHIAELSEHPGPEDLQPHLDKIEAQAMALGLPSFADLVTTPSKSIPT